MAGRTARSDLGWFMAALLLAVLSLVAAVRANHSAPLRAPPTALAAYSGTPASRRISLPPGQELAIAAANGRTERVTSLLAVPGRMSFGQFVWNEAGVPPGKAWVRVDLDRQLISVFRAGHEIGTAVILFGARDTPTPHGWFAVLAKAREHYSRNYDAPMPFMLRLTEDGVALHASMVREGSATHGCIGMPYAFAARLFDAMDVGDEVLVVGDRA